MIKLDRDTIIFADLNELVHIRGRLAEHTTLSRSSRTHFLGYINGSFLPVDLLGCG